jgi:hypothetical protein
MPCKCNAASLRSLYAVNADVGRELYRRKIYIKTRAPPPEARRAEPPQAAKRARQNAAKNPADLHAEGNARGGGERAHRERVPPGAQPWTPQA